MISDEIDTHDKHDFKDLQQVKVNARLLPPNPHNGWQRLRCLMDCTMLSTSHQPPTTATTAPTLSKTVPAFR